ncbi:protein kinase, partial [bacterium]|nr:protein kinase [bacterium]
MEPLYIEVVGSSGAPAELPRQGKLVIGSSSEKASFVVPGQGVAGVHCAIGRIKGGGWALRDLGSEFGTLLNGAPVEATRLSEGDEILLGSKKLRIFSLASAKGTPAGGAPGSAGGQQEPALEEPAHEELALEEVEELVLPEPAAPAAPPTAEPPTAEPPTAARTRSSSTPAKPRPAAQPGAPAITGYQVDRLLGRGAMGDVYLSTQESLDRRVALKVLKPKLAGDQVFVQRFKDEARAAARLNHPNIVTVFDVGQAGDHYFLSMEFMAGGSIEARLEELGPLPWREALDVLRDSAAGLVYAESRGIVHRDIKPENLMRNQDGVTKIADLGLAVQVEQETVDSSGGKIFGTPHFIAPEVAKGQPADARGDLYALGVTAYRVLSGKTPFEGPTSRDILRAAMTEEPARLGTLVPGLPARLEATVHRLLEKDPDKRPPSAS